MMKRVKTKAAFETRANRVISRGPGEIIRMGDEDIAEVAELVEILEYETDNIVSSPMNTTLAEPSGLGISVAEVIQTVDHGPGKKKK
jgi:hypothetical protein